MIHHTVHICETFLLSHFLLVWNIYEYLVPDLWYFYTDLDPTLFVTGFHETKKRTFFWVFLLMATVSSFTSVFKDIKSLQSHKRVEIRFFFVCWWKDLEPYKKLLIREAQKLMDSTDPAPENCKYQKYSFQCKWSRLEQQVNNVQVYIMNMT